MTLLSPLILHSNHHIRRLRVILLRPLSVVPVVLLCGRCSAVCTALCSNVIQSAFIMKITTIVAVRARRVGIYTRC